MELKLFSGYEAVKICIYIVCGYDVCGRALCSLRVIARSPSAMLYSLAIRVKKDSEGEEDSEE